MQDTQRRGERFRHPFDPLQVGVDRLFPLFDWIYDLTAEDFFDRVQGEFERGDDAEVPATTAQTPEEIGVAVFVDLQQTSIGGNELNRAHTRGAEAILAHEPAETAAEQITDDSNGCGEPIEWGQPKGVSRLDHICPFHTWLHACCRCPWIDLQTGHIGEVDQDRAISRVRMSMTSTLHRDGESVLTCKGDCGEHISGNGRHDDERWMLVKGRCIPCQTRPVVAIVSWDESTPLETCSQVLKIDRVERDIWMHRLCVLHRCFPS